MEVCRRAQVEAFNTLLNVLPRREVKASIVDVGVIPLLLRLMTGQNAMLVRQASQTMRELCLVPEYRAMAIDSNVFGSLTVGMQQMDDTDARVAIANAIGTPSACEGPIGSHGLPSQFPTLGN